MKLIQHEKVDLKMPKFLVDEKLTEHLEEIPLLKHLNKSFFCGIFGKAGGGKTSLLIGLLNTPKKFKKVFHKIYIFMPSTSRASMKDSILNILPEEQLYENVTAENLSEVYESLLENSEENMKSLLIFDDVQTYLKHKLVEPILLHIINNRRHLRCSIFILAQSYNKISKNTRLALTDMFIFKISKDDYKKIYEELVDIDKNDYDEIIETQKEAQKDEPNTFIYIHTKTDKFFINWDEIEIDD